MRLQVNKKAFKNIIVTTGAKTGNYIGPVTDIHIYGQPPSYGPHMVATRSNS